MGLGERTIPVEHISTQSSGGVVHSGMSSLHQTGTSSVPASPSRGGIHDQGYSMSSSSATTTTTTNSTNANNTTSINPSIGENGSLFTLTNIYTFGGDGNSQQNLSDQHTQPLSDKYRVKSFVEVFNQPSTQQDAEYERHYRETHSSSSVTRKIRTSATDSYDYDQNENYDSSRPHHHYEPTIPASSSSSRFVIGKTRSSFDDADLLFVSVQLESSTGKFSGTGHLSQLPSTFTDTHRKLRLWLEHVEQSLLNDKLRVVDLNAINAKRRVYKDLFDQTLEQERNLVILNEATRDFTSKLSVEHFRHLQEELINYENRLNDIKMFLSNALAKCSRFEQTLSEFEVCED